MLPRIDPARLETLEVDLLHFVGRRLEDDLVLVVLEEPVRILSESPVVGPPRRLHVADAPRLRTKHTEQRFGMGGPGPDFQVERLLQQAPVRGPERREFENEVLEGHAVGGVGSWRRRSRKTRSDFNVFSRCIVMSARCAISSSRSTRPSAGTSAIRWGAVLRDAARN